MIKRRTFLKSGTLTAFSVAAFGSIHWNGTRYVAGSPTTTDILGPFYRPGSPMRTNLVPAGSKGTHMTLTGTVFHEHGSAPLSGVTIEAWQCDENEYYDNTSDDYLFRGATKTDHQGNYHFNTIVPVPYKATPTSWRPAHIHLLISSPLYQDLITQIYFKGDQHLADDSSSASPTAVNRILEISEQNGQKVVQFDIVMKKHIPLDDAVYTKICGLYQLDQGMVEFYRQDDLLMIKRNGQISEGMVYVGNNTFEGAMSRLKVKFELQQGGAVKSIIHRESFNSPDQVTTSEGTKFLKYQ
jgi:protocatechuate 3,4-dioxygenase beta subunit